MSGMIFSHNMESGGVDLHRDGPSKKISTSAA